MVNLSSVVLDATFSALADPTRRAILARLAQGESSVTQLASPFHMSLPAVSKHLRILERAGLLAREREGRLHRCRLAPEPLRHAAEWIARYRAFWEAQFNALARHLQQTQEEAAWPPRKRPLKPASRSGGPSRRRAGRSFGPGQTRKS
ncbi:MAG TPA: metalloregulator ArsR/SmtB family transcription factor [Candidatus Methylomirabilis sp.]|nr:metalloregulator ArsR/SmtB family transcription factor [Candidatus Methylomirabilis sp.]